MNRPEPKIWVNFTPKVAYNICYKCVSNKYTKRNNAYPYKILFYFDYVQDEISSKMIIARKGNAAELV